MDGEPETFGLPRCLGRVPSRRFHDKLSSVNTRLVRQSVVSGLVAASLLGACGSAGDDGSATGGPARRVELTAVEFAFTADEAITISAGDTIEFDVRNGGNLEHQLEVLNAENRSLGSTERIPPGARRSVTVTFDQPGVYQVICDIDNHLSLGQSAQFEVLERD